MILLYNTKDKNCKLRRKSRITDYYGVEYITDYKFLNVIIEINAYGLVNVKNIENNNIMFSGIIPVIYT